MRRKLIIDTDCGGDDAVAILMALTHPDVEVVAITTVWGNVDVDQAVENAGKLLDFYDKDIPLYRGAAEPLMGTRETTQWGGYGSDGFGDAEFPRSARAANVSKTKHAAMALVEILSSIDVVSEGEDVVWQVVTLGPLTNIALALKLNPNLLANVGGRDIPGLVIMGGTIEAKGNSGLASEFNIHCDPEAARIVFGNRILRSPFYLISWELTVGCAMPWEFFDKWIGRKRVAGGRKVAVNQNRGQILIEKLFGRLEVFTRPTDEGTGPDTGEAEVTQGDTCVIPDAVAMVAALYPNFVSDSVETFATVEVHGHETRGATVIDWYGTDASMQKKGRWRNCRVVTKVDLALFLHAATQIVRQ